MTEFKVFTKEDLPSQAEKETIVALANLLDDSMVEYSHKLNGSNSESAVPTDHKVENFEADFFSIQPTAITLMLVDDVPVGFCWWVGADNYASIYNFYIHKDQQRKGYGTALMNNVLHCIKERNPDNPTVSLDTLPNNKAAHAFYRRLGFFVDCVSFRRVLSQK